MVERFIGTSFNDTFTSANNGFIFEGGAGNDVYVVNNPSVRVVEQVGGGDDEVRTSLGSYSLGVNVERLTYTGTGTFAGYGNSGDNIITGGNGNDTLFGGLGADQLIGGAGIDSASYEDSSSGGVTLNFKTGVHTGLAAGDTFQSIEIFRGSNYDDTFVSDATAHTFVGANGTDTLDYSGSAQGINLTLDAAGAGTGAGGDAEGDKFSMIERFIGTSFNDTFTSANNGFIFEGGAGNDVYVVNNPSVRVVEQVGGGDDEVRTSLGSYSLGVNVERLTYTGTGTFAGYGNSGDNIITGGNGNDTLFGGLGADQLIGGAGIDSASYEDSSSGGVTLNFKTGVHTGLAAGDTFQSIEIFRGSNYDDTFVSDATAHTFVGANGTDTLDYSGSAQGINLTLDAVGAGTGAGGDAEGDKFSMIERFIGTSFNDTFTSANNGFIFEGGAGNDVYVVNNPSVRVVEQVGGGDDEVRTSLGSYSLGVNVERLTYTGTGTFAGYGNSGDNIITGGNGNDTLFGGLGADQLIGGAGIDSASYEDSSSGGVTLNFKTGVHTGLAAGDTYDSIEIFRGSNYDDTFVSDATAHTFVGANGTDTLDYSGSAQAISLTLDAVGAGTGAGGDAEGDKFSMIERFIGTSFNDTFTSANNGFIFEGGAGNDVYVVNNPSVRVVEQVGGGDDEVRTSLGSYSLGVNVERLTYTGTGTFAGYGNSGDNIITGGNGNDTLFGGLGADQLIGGAGIDSASYEDSSSGGVTLNFKTGVHTGLAAGDTFQSIEIFRGSNYDDTFVSDATAHTFVGANGTDTLDYSGSAQGINLTLDAVGAGTGAGGDAEGDKFSMIERFIGTSFNDTFTSANNGFIFEGGAGNDVYVVNNPSVRVVEQVGGGDDEVRTSLGSYSLGVNVERLTYTGTGTFAGYGNSGDNIITGGNGNDTLFGGLGADQLIGGAGIDSASYEDSSSGGVTLNFKTGVHTGLAAGDTYDSIEIFRGSNYDDTFVSDATAHTFVGANGTDTLDYSGSAQAISLTLDAVGAGTGAGGDAEGDKFSMIERFIGTSFNDTFTSANNGFIFEGGAGNDVYVVNNPSVRVVEQVGGGDDEVRTSLGSYSLAANVERLTYTGTGTFAGYGNSGDNIITGGNGNDTLFGGFGADQLIGGAGIDSASYEDSSSGGVTLNFKTGVHTGLAAGDTYDSIEIFRGSNYDDTFVSDATAHTFVGANGTDTLDYSGSAQAISLTLDAVGAGTGAGGDAEGDKFSMIERFIGTSFNDTFTSANNGFIFEGGAGNDVYVVNNPSVRVVEQVGGGDDEVRTSLGSYSLAANVERLTYTGTGTFAGYGNSGDNIITGGNGNDTLFGGFGADQLIGGAGIDSASYEDSSSGGVTLNFKTGVHTGLAAGDTYDSIEIFRGSNYDDTFVSDATAHTFVGANGTDTLDYSGSAQAISLTLDAVGAGTGAGGDAEGDKFSMIERFIGTSFNDTFTSANNGFIFEGGAGNDVYVVNNPSVRVVEQVGGGDDEVRTSLGSYSLAANVERLTYTGTGTFAGYGNSGDNIITGGNGNDTLFGGFGADQLIGGAGIDSASYEDSSSGGVTLNFKTGVHTGLAAGDTYDSIEIFRGSNYDDTFVSDATAHTFVGANGTDTLDYSGSAQAISLTLDAVGAGTGAGGDAEGDKFSMIERFIGTSFSDTFTSANNGFIFEGGAGNDVYVVNNPSVRVVEQVGGGDDEVRTSLGSYSLAANVERLTYTGTGAFAGYGNSGDNIITGGNGNDTLFGGLGADQLIGGAASIPPPTWTVTLAYR
ncbi:beta strand repeat-containing protein [Pseudomonas entomophila]|uniref:beta strand repeat-containing protein n=1 Tax=Pseudomonas entomophila TaxID=312306 RepID=UPI0032C4657F